MAQKGMVKWFSEEKGYGFISVQEEGRRKAKTSSSATQRSRAAGSGA